MTRKDLETTTLTESHTSPYCWASCHLVIKADDDDDDDDDSDDSDDENKVVVN